MLCRPPSVLSPLCRALSVTAARRGRLGRTTEGRLLHFFFFFNDTATTEIYTLSLHDALPIYYRKPSHVVLRSGDRIRLPSPCGSRSEEHTSELQSLAYLVCRLLLEKKNK